MSQLCLKGTTFEASLADARYLLMILIIADVGYYTGDVDEVIEDGLDLNT